MKKPWVMSIQNSRRNKQRIKICIWNRNKYKKHFKLAKPKEIKLIAPQRSPVGTNLTKLYLF